MNEPVWFTESPWFVLKSVPWSNGQLQDSGPDYSRKSALMSGTTDQLAVPVECPIPYYSQKGKQTTMA